MNEISLAAANPLLTSPTEVGEGPDSPPTLWAEEKGGVLCVAAACVFTCLARGGCVEKRPGPRRSSRLFD